MCTWVTWQHNISYKWSMACEPCFKWFHFRWLLHQKEQYGSVARSPWQRYIGNVNVANMLITSCHQRSGIQSWDIAYLSSTKISHSMYCCQYSVVLSVEFVVLNSCFFSCIIFYCITKVSHILLWCILLFLYMYFWAYIVHSCVDC